MSAFSTLNFSAESRLFKLQPLIDNLLPEFHAIPQEQHLSVIEQMVPFKGYSALKQYLPNKQGWQLHPTSFSKKYRIKTTKKIASAFASQNLTKKICDFLSLILLLFFVWS